MNLSYFFVFLIVGASPLLSQKNEDFFYRINYDVFEHTDRSLEMAKQLSGEQAEILIAINYVHKDSELLYFKGESSWYYTGKETYPEGVEIVEKDFKVTNTLVTKNHKTGKTIESSALHPETCREIEMKAFEKEWEITSEVKVFERWIAQKAYLKYDPNTYAWFVPQINIPEGPFNAGYLPGLIVEFKKKYVTYRMTKFSKLPASEAVELPQAPCEKTLSLEEYDEFKKSTRPK